MKRIFSLVTLALFGCSTLILAAGKDPCTEKYDACVDHCMNVQAQCKLRGTDTQTCNDNFEKCKKNCETDKSNCQGKGNAKATPAPKKPAKTTTATKTDAQKK